jgi:hypothetical protein
LLREKLYRQDAEIAKEKEKLYRQDAEGAKERKSLDAKDAKDAKVTIIRKSKASGRVRWLSIPRCIQCLPWRCLCALGLVLIIHSLASFASLAVKGCCGVKRGFEGAKKDDSR